MFQTALPVRPRSGYADTVQETTREAESPLTRLVREQTASRPSSSLSMLRQTNADVEAISRRSVEDSLVDAITHSFRLQNGSGMSSNRPSSNQGPQVEAAKHASQRVYSDDDDNELLVIPKYEPDYSASTKKRPSRPGSGTIKSNKDNGTTAESNYTIAGCERARPGSGANLDFFDRHELQPTSANNRRPTSTKAATAESSSSKPSSRAKPPVPNDVFGEQSWAANSEHYDDIIRRDAAEEAAYFSGHQGNV
jgi:hypothetical protein